MTHEQFVKYCDKLVDAWGDDGKAVVVYVVENGLVQKGKTFDDFCKLCTACGGNWGAMLLTGIRSISKELYDLIPDEMGIDGMDAFSNLLTLIRLMGYEPRADE